MPETDPKRKGSEAPQENLEAALTAKSLEEEEHQKQLFSVGSKQNTISSIAEQNSQIPTQPSQNEAGEVEQPSTDSKQQEFLEPPITQVPQDNEQTMLKSPTSPTDHPTTLQQAETSQPSQSQQSPPTLEMIYSELMLLREGMQKLQTSIEALTEKVAVLKQPQTSTTDLPRGQIDQQRRQAQLSSSPRKTLGNKQTRGKKHDFNAVAYLQEHGKAKLQEELVAKTNSELTDIVRLEGIKKGKELKSMERQEMINEILLNAERRLNQGSSFL